MRMLRHSRWQDDTSRQAEAESNRAFATNCALKKCTNAHKYSQDDTGCQGGDGGEIGEVNESGVGDASERKAVKLSAHIHTQSPTPPQQAEKTP